MKTILKDNVQPAALCCEALLAEGWREYPNQFRKYARCFYKRFDTTSVCSVNSDKPGMQIEIAVSDGYAGGVSMEMELCAGLEDETWLKIQNYSLPKTVEEVTALIPRLLSIWESANTNHEPTAPAAQPKPDASKRLAL